MIEIVGAAGWVAGWLVSGRRRRLPPTGSSPGGPVSVIIPARNEAARLPGLLAALSREVPSGEELEIIVVDDDSDDGTAALAAAAGATVVRPSGCWTGWAGKPRACWEGARASRGTVLVFLDADTEPAPGFVARLAAAAGATDGLVSVQPWHRVERAYEHASAVGNVVALMAGTGPGRTGGSRVGGCWRGPVAFGPAAAVPRRLYLGTGGHALVRDAVVEDIALAEALAARGVPVVAYADAGERAVSYRMYPEGPATLVDGWTRTLATGAARIPVLRSALVGLWVAGAGAAALASTADPLLYLIFVIQFAALFRRAGGFRWTTALVYPLPLAAFIALFARSVAYRLGRRPLRWRGRTFDAAVPRWAARPLAGIDGDGGAAG